MSIARHGVKMIQRAANAAGVEIRRYYKNEWRWSREVDEYYSVEPNARWGYGKPVHPQIAAKLNEQREEFSALLRRFSECRAIFESVPESGDPLTTDPYWQNDYLVYLDAAALAAMLVFKSPLRYFEIGSGNSTKFARHTIKCAGLPTQIISMDPQPRAQIDAICDVTIRERLEDCDLSVFDQLAAGDILFFDGSHRAFTNSDVTVFFLELMPRLKPGVIVQIHDIFLPWDYPPGWKRRMYSEQYILAAMLLCPKPPFKVLLPNSFVCGDVALRTLAKSVLEPRGNHGVSFWMEIA